MTALCIYVVTYLISGDDCLYFLHMLLPHHTDKPHCQSYMHDLQCAACTCQIIVCMKNKFRWLNEMLHVLLLAVDGDSDVK